MDEPESASLAADLAAAGYELVPWWLLRAELHYAVVPNATFIPRSSVRTLLYAVTLVDVTRGALLAAGTDRPLRAGDAIHLATVLRSQCRHDHCRTCVCRRGGRRAYDRSGVAISCLRWTPAMAERMTLSPSFALGAARVARRPLARGGGLMRKPPPRERKLPPSGTKRHVFPLLML
jgi:hypothetical protein